MHIFSKGFGSRALQAICLQLGEDGTDVMRGMKTPGGSPHYSVKAGEMQEAFTQMAPQPPFAFRTLGQAQKPAEGQSVALRPGKAGSKGYGQRNSDQDNEEK